MHATKSYYLCGPPLCTLTHTQTKCNGTAVLYGGMINKNRKSPLLCGVVHYDNVGYFVSLVLIFSSLSLCLPFLPPRVGGLVSGPCDHQLGVRHCQKPRGGWHSPAHSCDSLLRLQPTCGCVEASVFMESA